MGQLTDVISHVSFLFVFTEGLLSFFSPCILPLLPVYMGYLSGQTDQQQNYTKRKIIFMTLSFILGIFVAIFLLNTVFNVFASFFRQNMSIFIRLGGVLIIFLGIHQLGFLKFNSLEKTKRLQLKRKNISSFLFAFLLGFTFSFSWTPCIGPALSSILILAGSSQSFFLSNLLMMTYALGLTIPFLILGLFTNQAMQFFGKYKNIMKYTVKIGGAILIVIGIMMFSGKMNSISNYLSPTNNVEQSSKDETIEKDVQQLDFTLYNQNGETVSFADYRGKVIFLNFWATWCPPCKAELPHIQDLSEKYKNSQDVAILTVVLPGGKEQSKEGIIQFLKKNKYDFPVLIDDGIMYNYFGITSFPTTFMIKRDGTPLGYVTGQITKDMMENLINQTLEEK